MVDIIINILQNAALPILYGVIGLLVALRNKKPLQVSLFAKTVLISLVSAGAVSQLRFDQIVQVLFTTGLAESIDELINLKMRSQGE